ncbi:MAG: methyltransferase [Candidatus Verstraetearchaeota archaeon]|nr:methyltransferase [Candidatus Verstraetearchaeota archaeon]
MRIRGLDIRVYDGVYPPSEDTFLLMDAVSGERAARGLELCSGTGAVGLSIASRVGEMVAVDLNPVAAMNTLLNYTKNGMRVHVVVGDLFSPIRGEFDLIIMNPPYLPDGEGIPADLAWSGGASGRSVIDRFISEVGDFLSPGGRAYMLQSSLNGIEESIKRAKSEGLYAEIVGRKGFDFESLVVIRMAWRLAQREQVWKS